jgi:hypothetical protein
MSKGTPATAAVELGTPLVLPATLITNFAVAAGRTVTIDGLLVRSPLG